MHNLKGAKGDLTRAWETTSWIAVSSQDIGVFPRGGWCWNHGVVHQTIIANHKKQTSQGNEFRVFLCI